MENAPGSSTTPDVMDIDRHAVLAEQGATLVAILNFLAAAAISTFLASGTWFPGDVALYRAMSMAPGILATILAVVVGPRLWRRLAVGRQHFSVAKGALAGALTVILVQTITIELFLTVAFVFLWLSESGSTYLGEFPNVFLMWPLYSVSTVGVFTIPAGTAIGFFVAVYCSRQSWPAR